MFEVGQSVIVLTRRHKGPPNEEPGTISKIARKYLTITIPGRREYAREQEFSIETQDQRGSSGAGARWCWFETPETRALAKRWARSRAVWKSAGIEHRGYSREKLTIEQHEAISSILDPSFVPEPAP